MGQILLRDNIPNLVLDSSTQISMPVSFLGQPTRITVGGQSYTPSATLLLNPTTTTGAGGRDTGAIGAIQLWYVYAIVNQSSFALSLIASLVSPSAGPTMPTGYGSAYSLVGAFYTNSSSVIGSVVAGALGGTVSTEAFSWSPVVNNGGARTFTNTGLMRRIGDKIELHFNLNGNATASGSGATTPITVSMPGSLQIDTVKDVGGISHESVASYGIVNAAQYSPISAYIFDANAFRFFLVGGDLRTTDMNVARDMDMQGKVSLCIQGWKPTLL